MSEAHYHGLLTMCFFTVESYQGKRNWFGFWGPRSFEKNGVFEKSRIKMQCLIIEEGERLLVWVIRVQKIEASMNRDCTVFIPSRCRVNWFLFVSATTKKPTINAKPPGGGALLSNGLLGCAAGWGRIFTTGLTIMGLPFQAFSIEYLQYTDSGYHRKLHESEA